MTTVSFPSETIGIDMLVDFFPVPDSAFKSTATSTTFTLYYQSSEYDRFAGTGLKYDNAGLPQSGTIASWTYVFGGKTYLSATGINMPVATYMSYLLADDWSGFLQDAFSEGDKITGSIGQDQLYGFGGNDTINGGAGIDTLAGGTGNDTYIVTAAGDVILENADEGMDTVQSSVSVGAAANIENVTLTGSAAISASGNGLGNVLSGNSGKNTLDGLGGDDTLLGGAGNDTLLGGAGNDLLDGGIGKDVMKGGADNDTYVVDSAGDIIDEAGSGSTNDQVRSSISINLTTLAFGLIEHATLIGTAAINATGNTVGNRLVGNNAANVLDGKGGADTMIGGKGADTYIVDDAGDQVEESVGGTTGGIDVVKSSVNFSLALLGNVEKLTLTDLGHVNATGNALANTLTGNDGNNRLDGLAGKDTLVGGKGNDTYVVDSSGDVVTESIGKGGGIDTVESSVTFTLASRVNVENLTLTGVGNLVGTGNALANIIIGNDGSNKIDGGTGNDWISGGIGIDTLLGGAGDDVLDGGTGADVMKGGAGNDRYVVDNAADVVDEEKNSNTGDSVATIFSIDLSTFAAGRIEHATLIGADDTDAKGSSSANILTGNTGDNVLDGGQGADSLIGGAGNDTYIVDSVGDVVTELGADTGDTVKATLSYVLSTKLENLVLAGTGSIDGTGNSSNNKITGNDGANQLDGQGGADTLAGGKGNDTYLVDDAGDKIIEDAGQGTDTVNSKITNTLGEEIENLTLLGTNAIDGTGNALANVITGNDGDNRLDAGDAGADTLIGGKGNDVYVVNHLEVTIVEALSGPDGGVDRVEASVSFNLGTIANLENLTMVEGKGNLNATGNSLGNLITGNSSANVLEGGGGNDTLIANGGADSLLGGAGNDLYVIDTNLVVIDEQGNSDGGDTVKSSFAVDLTKLGAGQIEHSTLVGAADIDATGNAAANILIGNSGKNVLSGGASADTLTGGVGADVFSFATGDSGAAFSTRDQITDFVSGQDLLDLSAIDADTTLAEHDRFRYLGAEAFDGGAGALRTVFNSSLGITFLEGDTNGDGVADFSIELKGNIELASTDFTADSLAPVVDLNLTGDDKANKLLGLNGNDTLSGLGGDDTLSGGLGNDTLDGGTGGDGMKGGAGNDTYYVDSYLDSIFDSSGTDTVVTSKQFSLGGGIENLTLLDGAGDLSAFGDSKANALVGNDGDNEIWGGAGADTLTGGDGKDLFVFDKGDAGSAPGARDLITDFSATDDLLEFSSLPFGWGSPFALLGTSAFSGQAFELRYSYDAGRNVTILEGDADGDKLADLAIEFVGNIAITKDNFTYGSILFPVDWVGSDAWERKFGMSLDDSLSGMGGNDNLSGWLGNDVLDGGSGNDTLIGGAGNDDLTGGTGDDELNGDTGDDTIEGGAGGDDLLGGSGNDILDGGAGIDHMNGMDGDDTFHVDNLNDVIFDISGSDTVISEIDYFLQDGLEKLVLADGAGDIDGFGNAADNILVGNGDFNRLIGAGGVDTLTGGGGSDVFAFSIEDTGKTAGTRDLITDFVDGIDQFDFSAIDANTKVAGQDSFTFIGAAGFSGVAGELHAVFDASHNVTVVEGDTNGDKVADFGVELAGNHVLAAADFSPIHLTGDGGNNTLLGTTREDLILGLGGDDVIQGNSGDDVIDGGAGDDTVVFAGNASDYQLLYGLGGLYVSDLSDGHGGVDGLFNVEHVQFADKTIDVAAEPIVTGVSAGDLAGYSVAAAGDVNNDGLSDFIIGAPTADPNGAESGAAYVIFGSAAGLPDSFSLASLNGTNGFRLSGVAAGDNAGLAVGAAGDINGDGYGDVVIGAPGADPHGSSSGAAYVVFGHAGGFAADINLATLNGANGFRLDGGAASDFAGGAVQTAGDLNNDGFADLIIGANGWGVGGSAYVVFGHGGAFGSSLDLSTLNGTNGTLLMAPNNGADVGWSVAAAGDFNADGIDDVLVGAPGQFGYGNGTSGVAYLVLGHDAPFAATQNMHLGLGKGVIAFTGVAQLDTVGFSVAGAGDVNGDGYDDIILGTPDAANKAGASYVVFGTDETLYNVDLSTLNGVNGFAIEGIQVSDLSGSSVSSAGDVNGDGYADILIGAPNGSSNDRGNAYVLFGRADGFGKSIDPNSLDATQGFWVIGDNAADGAGQSVSAAGDLDGDGYDDLVVGAPWNGSAGAALVVYGSDLLGVDPNFGTSKDNGLVGGKDADVLVGKAGDDTLSGVGGDDLLQGGDGNDALDGGLGDDVVNGGAGGDTLTGGEGNDRISGGAGNDVAVFDGDSSKYAVSYEGGSWLVTDLAGAEGNDVLFDVERLQFGDKSIDLPQPQASVDLADLDGHTGFRLNGANAGEQSGYSVASAGDVNGDGLDDLIIGAFRANVDGVFRAGTTYVVYGGDANLDALDKADGKADGQVDLGLLNGVFGFQVGGVNEEDLSGYSASSAGDVNADGFDDILVGSRDFDPDGVVNAGSSYIVLGGASNLAALDASDGTADGKMRLGNVSGGTGYRLDGADVADASGWSVAPAGDLNGDGYDDVVIGARSGSADNDGHSGAAYVVYGGAGSLATLDAADGALDSKLDLSKLDGKTGFSVDGFLGNVSWPEVGEIFVNSAGDLNGDGYADLAVGSEAHEIVGIVFGGVGNLAALDGADGKADGHAALASFNGVFGYKFVGVSVADGIGGSIASAGDVNADGIGDLIIGAPYASPDGPIFAGASYVVYGGTVNLGALDATDGIVDGQIDLNLLNGTTGFRVDGVASSDYSGTSAASAGDVNGDGKDDLLIGSFRFDSHGIQETGAAYILYGGLENINALDQADKAADGQLDLSLIDGIVGFRLEGVADTDLWGQHVAPAGDVNGDGYADYMIGSYVAESGGKGSSGATAIVYGGSSYAAGIAYVGDGDDNALTGTGAAETFIGDLGADTLIGGGGKDALQGGAGDDHISVSDVAFLRVNGGGGSDTLLFDLAGAVDLGDLDGKAATENRGRVSGVETLDFTNGAANAITLSLADVLDLDVDNRDVGGVGSLDNVLRLDGDAIDSLTLSLADGWGTADTTTFTGYAIYVVQNVRIAVDQDIAVSLT